MLIGAAIAFAIVTGSDAIATRIVKARRDSFAVIKGFKA